MDSGVGGQGVEAGAGAEMVEIESWDLQKGLREKGVLSFKSELLRGYDGPGAQTQSDRTAGRACALHVVDPGLIPDIQKDSLSPAMM